MRTLRTCIGLGKERFLGEISNLSILAGISMRGLAVDKALAGTKSVGFLRPAIAFLTRCLELSIMRSKLTQYRRVYLEFEPTYEVLKRLITAF